MRSAQLGIVIVVMVVRAPPNAAGAQGKDAEQPHKTLRHPRPGQDGMMLLIVINDEKPEEEESTEDAAHHFGRQIEIPVRTGQRDDDEEGGGKDMPPTFPRGVPGVPRCGKDQFAAAS